MFIRVVRSNGIETIRECEGVFINQCMGDTSRAFFSLEPNGPSYEIEKEGSSVYLMNDLGQTIDSYRWPEFNGVAARSKKQNESKIEKEKESNE